jgi:hypothetical protein
LKFLLEGETLKLNLHPKNGFLTIVLTFAGIVKFVNPVQLSKLQLPRLVKLFGSCTEVSLEHLVNALGPISVTPSGITTLSSAEQPEKASSLIFFTLLGKTTFTMFLLSLYAFVAIYVIPYFKMSTLPSLYTILPS